MIRTGIALLGLAVILGILGLQQWNQRQQADAVPVDITLRGLLDSGAARPGHIRLEKFEFCEHFAYGVRPLGSEWNVVFLPIVPAGEGSGPALRASMTYLGDKEPGRGRPVVSLPGNEGRLAGQAPLPGTIEAIVVSKRLRSEQDVGDFVRGRSIQGLVATPADALSRRERALLQDRYPSVNLSKCLLIHEGQAPPSTWLLLLLLGGSGASLVSVGGLFITAWRRRPRQSPPPPNAAEQVERWAAALERQKRSPSRQQE